MKKQNKILSLLLSCALTLGLLTGCGNTAESKVTPAPATDQKLSIVTTIFPEYDWVREILGDRAAHADITMLLNNGVDLHSYQPTVEDMVKISNCDLFIYVGGESDEWVEDALAGAANKDMVVINLLEALGDAVKEEEVVEGMQEEHGHEHDHSKEASNFADDEVQDRGLSDWAGQWQSGYPLALDGSLDEAFASKAETGSMTAEEYKQYYINGYKTEYDYITIDGNSIEFTDHQGSKTKSEYQYLGYYIQDWSTGTRAAMYRFEAIDKGSGAPIYVEFNDHMIEPAQSEHFHIRMSDIGFDAIVDPENSFPTFYPAELTPEEVCAELAGHDHHEDDHEEPEYDEHVWLSLRNAAVLVEVINEKLGKLDADHADVYSANTKAYVEKLNTLDRDYAAAVKAGKQDTILFGDRFPFRYLADDYGLNYYAAFVGCSAETEASFETIAFLAGKVDKLGLNSVLTLESGDGKIARTIVETSAAKSAQILRMDSLQSTTAEDVADGATYLGSMEQNLDVLKQALK